jgi:glycyl-tRNA synthetase alpha subunit
MTKAKDRAAQPKDRQADHKPKTPGNGRELYVEILRDLDLDPQQANVRGGACPTSKPV